MSCQQSLAKIAGKSIVTLEGFDEDERQRYADAFAACGGLQCGFCIPGIIVRAKAQIDKKGDDLTARGHGPPPRRPPVPLHRLRQDPRCHRGGGEGKQVAVTPPGGIGSRGAKYEAARAAPSATAATSTTSARPGCSTPRCT